MRTTPLGPGATTEEERDELGGSDGGVQQASGGPADGAAGGAETDTPGRASRGPVVHKNVHVLTRKTTGVIKTVKRLVQSMSNKNGSLDPSLRLLDAVRVLLQFLLYVFVWRVEISFENIRLYNVCAYNSHTRRSFRSRRGSLNLRARAHH